jgi:hypothetical protein
LEPLFLIANRHKQRWVNMAARCSQTPPLIWKCTPSTPSCACGRRKDISNRLTREPEVQFDGK